MSNWPETTTEDEDEQQLDEPEVSYYEGEPVLVPGDAGEHVAELCKRLAAAGHETAVHKGEAPAILNDAVYEAVEAFRGSAGVEDELAKGGLHIVGPQTWAALAKATA